MTNIYTIRNSKVNPNLDCDDDLYGDILGVTPSEMAGEDGDMFISGVSIIKILAVLDTSGSMREQGGRPEEACRKMLKGLAEKNRTSIDFRFNISFARFNGDTHFVKGLEKPVAPEKALEQIVKLKDEGKDPFECSGVTNIGGAVNFIDGEFRTGKPMTSHCHKNDPKSIVILITDNVGTDDPASRQESIDKLLNNSYFTKTCDCICIFTPPKGLREKRESPSLEKKRLEKLEKAKRELTVFTGSADKVLTLDDNITDHLERLLIEGTIAATDATRTTPDDDGEKKSAADIMRETEERMYESDESVISIVDFDLSDTDDTISKEIARRLGWSNPLCT